MAITARYNLNKPGVLRLLAELKASSSGVASICVPPGSAKATIESMMATVLDIKTAPGDLLESMAKSPTGSVLFWGLQHRYLVIPPFPLAGENVSFKCEIEPLVSLLNKELILGIVLVRLGEYVIGVFQGEKLLSSKAGTGLVHARHRQGGSSSHRFVRHREKQMETFFTRVCQHAREQLEPYVKLVDYVVYGGSKETIQDFRKQCHFLEVFDSRALDRLLGIREPRRSSLAEGIQEAWSSRVLSW